MCYQSGMAEQFDTMSDVNSDGFQSLLEAGVKPH